MSLISLIEQYQADPDVLIHFTNTLKLGIYPRTKWSDPIGIYFYPLRDMMTRFQNKDVPYGSDFRYAFIVRNTGLMLNLRRVTDTHIYFEQLENYYRDYLYEPEPDSTYHIDDPITYYQYCSTRWLEKYPHGGKALWELTDRFAEYLAPRMKKDMRLIWRKMFVSLGFDGVIDHGDEIISGNEPHQAVLFNPTFDVLGATLNDLVPVKSRRSERVTY